LKRLDAVRRARSGREDLPGLEQAETNMTQVPTQPKIYHITPVDRLPAIIAAGGLLSDAKLIAQGALNPAVGMPHIKQRRLKLPVPCHPGAFVGEYVPFYFCPRSVMLYIIHMGNHPDLVYQGGQAPIVHLESDLHRVVAWARKQCVKWAFSLSNAGAYCAEFRASLTDLNQINWDAVHATTWPRVREDKQAEFLVHDFFPWELVDGIGVLKIPTKRQVEAAIASNTHRPPVDIRSDWYYLTGAVP